MSLRSLIAAIAILIAAGPALGAETCRPTAESVVAFAPMTPAWHTSGGVDLDELEQAVEALSRLPVAVSPMLGAVQIGAIAMRNQADYRVTRGENGRECKTLTRIEYSFGFRERRLVISDSFGRDPCLTEFVVAGFRKLADFEDDFARRAGEAIRGPVETALRTIPWTGEETPEEREQTVALVLDNSVQLAFRTLNRMLRDHRAQYYETMRAQLATVCEGRGETILLLRTAPPA